MDKTMTQLLHTIIGSTISELWSLNYHRVGLRHVCIGLSSSQRYRFEAHEVATDGDESYSLGVQECTAEAPAGSPKLDVRIGRLALLERDEWTIAVEPIDGIIGNNPRLRDWGKVGSAPSTGDDVVTVTAAVVIESPDSSRRMMVFISDYPGLVGFTNDGAEIEIFLNGCSVRELSKPDFDN